MNNFKKSGKNKCSCGIAKNIDDSDYTEFMNVYHSIGNMTPVPWFNVNGGIINEQSLHKALDERWDLYLKVLSENWNFWKSDQMAMTFDQYMVLTGQQIYFKAIYDDISEYIECVINTKDIAKIEDKLSEIDIKRINRWNRSILLDWDENELINYSDIIDEQPDKALIKIIIALIKIRCHVIRELLKWNYYNPIVKKSYTSWFW